MLIYVSDRKSRANITVGVSKCVCVSVFLCGPSCLTHLSISKSVNLFPLDCQNSARWFHMVGSATLKLTSGMCVCVGGCGLACLARWFGLQFKWHGWWWKSHDCDAAPWWLYHHPPTQCLMYTVVNNVQFCSVFWNGQMMTPLSHATFSCLCITDIYSE